MAASCRSTQVSTPSDLSCTHAAHAEHLAFPAPYPSLFPRARGTAYRQVCCEYRYPSIAHPGVLRRDAPDPLSLAGPSWTGATVHLKLTLIFHCEYFSLAGTTGHAEAVKIEFDRSTIAYAELVDVSSLFSALSRTAPPVCSMTRSWLPFESSSFSERTIRLPLTPRAPTEEAVSPCPFRPFPALAPRALFATSLRLAVYRCLLASLYPCQITRSSSLLLPVDLTCVSIIRCLPEYRSAIFTTSPEQAAIARQVRDEVQEKQSVSAISANPFLA